MSVELLLSIFGAACAIVAGFWAIANWALTQFDKRLEERFATQERARKEGRQAMEERFKTLEGQYAQLDKDVRRILIELPREYVRREDYVRSQSVIEGKLDSLALRIENALLKGTRA